MKNPKAIVAYAVIGRVIGINGDLPWKLFSDMMHFKKTTMGHIVIMGSKSYESIPDEYRPLEGRINIVLSRNPDYAPSQANDQTFVCRSLEEAWNLALSISEGKEIFIIGGGEIYMEALSTDLFTIDEIIASEVEGQFEGDTFFPEIDLPKWERTVLRTIPEQEGKNSAQFSIVRYTLIAA